MSMSDRYLAYLNQHVEIAPANSEEEVQAAHLLEQLLQSGDLETSQQDFECPNDTSLVAGILMVVMFLGVVVAGIGGIACAVIGFILAVVCFALLALRYTGRDIIASLLPPARSQNVIAVHRGCGPHAGKGVRPIVVMAHYDTGHEDLLANPSVARFQGPIYTAAPIGAAVAAVCSLLELFVGMPEPFLRIVWVVGIVCSLPMLVVGVTNIASRFMPLSGAANDNNASLAAMLGVAEDVASSDPETQAARMGALQVAEEEQALADEELEELGIVETPTVVDSTGTVVTERVVPQQVEGVRHGKAVLEALGMLPETCEIEYIEPEPVVVAEEPAVVAEPEPEPEPEPSVVIPDFLTSPRRTTASGARIVSVSEEQEPSSVGVPTPRSARKKEHPLSDQFQSTGRVLQREAATRQDAKATDESLAAPAQHSLDAEAEKMWQAVSVAARAEDVSEQDTAAMATVGDSDSTVEMPMQAAGEDVAPGWGESTFTPQAMRPQARGNRVSLFDLPDPSSVDEDPLGPVSRPQQVPQPRPRPAVIEAETFTEDEVVAPDPAVTHHDPDAGRAGKKSLRERLHLGRHKQEEESMSEWLGVDKDFDAKSGGESIGSWDHFDDDSWKGGAAKAPDADVSDEELEDAILDMDYVNLVAHDIWFVATGASELDHAGAKAFLDAHRKDLRGAFLVNLSCIGAGDLTLLTEEGFGTKRHVDRRLLRMFDRIARDLHIQLAEEPRGWADTDATPAMRQSIRSATLMGCDFGTVPALSHTAQNVPENVEPEKLVEVNRLVSELIRRS